MNFHVGFQLRKTHLPSADIFSTKQLQEKWLEKEKLLRNNIRKNKEQLKLLTLELTLFCEIFSVRNTSQNISQKILQSRLYCKQDSLLAVPLRG